MPETITIDIENLETTGNQVAIVTFPQRVKVLSATFTVNLEAYGTEEDNRNWKLYCLAGHPYTDEGDDQEWVWPMFYSSAKPVVERSNNMRYRSNTALTGVHSAPFGDPYTIREVHEGVLDAGDYVSIWVELDSGNIDTITWANTRALVTLQYEETTKKSAYEERNWWSWD